MYTRALVDHGYEVDSSVTPHVDWRSYLGNPPGSGGPDFRSFPESTYLMNPHGISRAGHSSLLRAPMTIVSRCQAALARGVPSTVSTVPYARRVVRRALSSLTWLRPNSPNGADFKRVLDLALLSQYRDWHRVSDAVAAANVS